MKRRGQLIVILAFVFIIVSIFPSGSAVNVSSCQTLNSANTVYTLTSNLYSATSCITISANNITLDGQGYSINGSNVYPQPGVYLVQNSNFSTVKNLQINNFSIGIYSPYAPNMTFINNTISNSANYGSYLPGYSNNILMNNTILNSGEYAIMLSNSNKNLFYNNIINGSTNYALYLSSSSNNIFSNNTILNSLGVSIHLIYSFNNSFSSDYIQKSRGNAINISHSNNNNFSNIQVLLTNSSSYDLFLFSSNKTKLSNFNYFLNYSFFNSKENIFENSSYGQIQISDMLNGQGQNFTKEIFFRDNYILINSSSNSGLFNRSANVTLYGIGNRGFSNPVILRNGVLCSNCYQYTSLTVGNVSFGINSEGQYSVGEGPASEETDTEEEVNSRDKSQARFVPNSAELAKGYNQIMWKNWKIIFYAGTEIHTLKIDDILENSVKLSASSELQEATLLVGEEKKFEVSGDNFYDISVKLNSIDYTNKFVAKANITVLKINEEIGYPEAKNVKNTNSEVNLPNKKWTFIFIAILIGVVCGAVYIYKKNRHWKKMHGFI